MAQSSGKVEPLRGDIFHQYLKLASEPQSVTDHIEAGVDAKSNPSGKADFCRLEDSEKNDATLFFHLLNSAKSAFSESLLIASFLAKVASGLSDVMPNAYMP